MGIKENIKELREKHNLSQSELANKLFVSRQAVSQWENGETTPSIETLNLIKKEFDVTFDELIEDKKEIKINKKKIIFLVSSLLLTIIMIIGSINLIVRATILNSSGYKNESVITRNETIIFNIDKNITRKEYKIEGKPSIKCNLEDTSLKYEESNNSYLFIDNEDNYILINSYYKEDVINPLEGTIYYDYYFNKGYTSFVSMMNLAMYKEINASSIFLSKEELHILGGSIIVKDKLLGDKNADYYPVGGYLEDESNKIYLNGLALKFSEEVIEIIIENESKSVYFITLKNKNNSIKDANFIKSFIERFWF